MKYEKLIEHLALHDRMLKINKVLSCRVVSHIFFLLTFIKKAFESYCVFSTLVRFTVIFMASSNYAYFYYSVLLQQSIRPSEIKKLKLFKSDGDLVLLPKMAS